MSSNPEPVRAAPSVAQAEPARQRTAAPDQAVIGKGVTLKGEVTGSDPVFVDGRVEGAIHIPGERVTVGKNGSVVGRSGSGAACITAREIVILGSVTGDISAGERVDLRAGASLTGNVTTARVSIEDGAYFRGGIDIRKEDPNTVPAAARFEAVQPV
ncbi:MAG TPA: polymer-forming cytoskeletal protein [Terracidiphilus sp.]|nr:polymer-forming cytoskeletal protein [Terracidiphilus sp.]